MDILCRILLVTIMTSSFVVDLGVSSTVAWRDDGQCGGDFLAPNGEVAQCDPGSNYPCCSPYNWCGATEDHCDCEGCTDYSLVQSNNCPDGQFTCTNGLCIPEVQRCDAINDCWDNSDEDTNCTTNEACEKYGETGSDVPCKLADGVLYSNSITTDRISFLFDAADVAGISTISITSNNKESLSFSRYNISTSSDQRLVYAIKSESVAVLRIPLVIHRGDTLTITVVQTDDPRSMPWFAGLLPQLHLTGFLLNSSCPLTLPCRQWVMTSTFPEIDKCYFLQITKFGIEWFRKCLPFCFEDVFVDSDGTRLTFPRTNVSTTSFSVEKCLLSDVSLASRSCVGKFAAWSDPVRNDCPTNQNISLESLAELYLNGEIDDNEVIAVSDAIVAATESAQDDGTNLNLTVTLLEKVVAVESPSAKVTSNVLTILDSIFKISQEDVRKNVEEIKTSRILQAMENQLTSFQLGNEQNNLSFVGSSVAAQAVHFDPSVVKLSVSYGVLFSSSAKDATQPFYAGETFLEVSETSTDETKDKRGTVTLPGSFLKTAEMGSSKKIPITFVAINPGNIFHKSSTTDSPYESLGSVIISAKIESHAASGLETPVKLTFHTYNKSGSSVADVTKQCVYWEFAPNGSEGRWSSDGCQVQTRFGEEDDGSITECHCDHLTNFAVLIDVHGDIDNTALDILSTIGCVVSIAALFVTIVTSLAVKKLRERRSQQILLNLCFALLGLYLFFLLGINQIQTEIGCIIFGALIHFFCLSSLAWMAVEATNMYLLFVKVFDSGVSGFIWKAMLVGWGVPFIAVFLCAVFTPQNYRSTYCFPRAGTSTFTFGVLLLVACILLYNVVIFTLVFYKLFLVRAQIKSNSTNRKDLKRQVQNVVAIFVLLGLTWIFGFLSLGNVRFIFDLLFVIFCSLQGLFVFLLFCLRQEESRNAWKNCFRKGKTTLLSSSYAMATLETE